MTTNIATVFNECLKEFTGSTNSGTLTRYDNEVSKHRWLDELGRLRIWAGNIGAHQTGQSSLDYRLRDASHLKNETVKLLQRLLRLLRDLGDVMKDEDQVENETDDEVFFEDSDLELGEDNDMTDIQMLFQSLRNTINLLFQISMAIRRPADHDRLLGVKIKDESYFEPWAQQHISHKFPNAMISITHRLGAAMARQKAVLKYFERHRAKLGKGLSDNGDVGTQLSETTATGLVLAEDADHLQFLETNSTSGISQTSYAPSIFTSNESLSVPNPPKESADENPFECPYCCLVIKIKGKKDWARHVFRDLMPYVCISTECSTPSKLYGSRRQWYDHMCQSHSMLAHLQSGSSCPLCQVPLHPPVTFDRHVGHHMEQLALFVLPRTTPSEEAFSRTASNAASLAAFGDESTHCTDAVKAPPQMVDWTNLDDESSYPEDLSLDINHLPPEYYYEKPSSAADDIEDREREAENYQAARSGRTSTAALPLSTEALLPTKASHRNGSESGSQNSRSNSSRGSATASRKEEDENMTLVLNGVQIGFTSEAVAGKSINIRAGETGAVRLNIGGPRPPKQHVNGTSSDYTGGSSRRELEDMVRRPRNDRRSERSSLEKTEGNSHSFLLDGDMGDLESTILPAATQAWKTHAEHSTVTSNESHDAGVLVNAPDSWQVEELTRTISHANNRTDDLEGGSSFHDGKKKAE
ncbi:hypothetical protein E8E15_006607 [Penicillium rubens]|jgi:hypothetical protein|uniref:Oxidoreductase acuF-like C2H2 type zinc-finger domain-containing protein n=1 Tax=Penicillium chrysogenum TaxID=5076 RepID=A0A162CMJ7_PENCH|nr:uncharacterized protein N7525_011308 [Penicillium rubens]KZN83660.1 hypothetical protein EN45_107660 [Penicillium chrysogenum]KAF3015229.1 hypothetical protein E8E15_006607 [Penicillium rubens]KAJ5036953.1 hypothetical protein NUH16_004834 [Penicillium rubens]KAJ5822024.1 hypothetical protein N7525_011308 [Penicillium rubens]KAJ5859662.1 hypothetical protein N7534_004939 [Penicillium rubens]